MESIIVGDQGQEQIDTHDLTSAPGNGMLQPLVDHCFKLYEDFGGGDAKQMSEYRRNKIQEIKDSRKAYDQIADQKTFPWTGCSNIVIPLSMITVDNLEPRIVAGLLGKDPYIDFEMKGKTEKDKVTKLIQDWWNKELKDVVKIDKFTMDTVHNILLDGTIYYYPIYDSEKVVKRDFQYDQQGQVAIGQDGKPQISENEVSMFEGGRCLSIPFTDMFCADDVGTSDAWDKADLLVNWNYTYGELMQKVGQPGWVNIGTYLVPTKQKRRKQKLNPMQEVSKMEITGKENIECLLCQISFPIAQDLKLPEEEQTDFKEQQIVAIIEKKTKTLLFLRRRVDLYMENKAIIRRIRLYPEEGRSFGTSVFGKLRAVQTGASDIYNRMIDAALVTLIPWFFHDSRAGNSITGEKELYPGKGVKVDSVDGIKFPTFNLNPQHYLPMLEMLFTLWERIGSIGDYQVGLPNKEGGKRTLGEVQSVLMEGAIKHNYQARITQDEFIGVITTLYDLYYQNMPFNKTFEDNGKPTPLPRQAMKRGYRFVMKGSTDMANAMVARQEAIELMQMFAQDQLMNPVKLREDVLESYKRFNTQEYINPQLMQAMQVLIQNPEIMQKLVMPYLQEKAEVQKRIGGGANAGTITQ
jgi:hypothetical protein